MQSALGYEVVPPVGGEAPRGLLCAVPGMGMSNAYFSTHADPSASLTAAAAAAGLFTVVPDRPGYGASADVVPGPPSWQAGLVETLLEELLEYLQAPLPVLLVGHSLGGRVALELATRGRLPVAGLEIVATGSRLRAGVIPTEAARRHDSWGPPGCYPPETFRLARDLVSPVPPGEQVADADWSASFVAAAKQVTCPVRVVWPEHDRWWRRDADEVRALEVCFSRSPELTTCTAVGSGHNLHLDLNARRNNENTIAFLRDCLLRQPAQELQEVP